MAPISPVGGTAVPAQRSSTDGASGSNGANAPFQRSAFEDPRQSPVALTPPSAPQSAGPGTIELSPTEAATLRRALTQWRNSAVVTDADVTAMKTLLERHPVLRDARGFTVTARPETSSAIDNTGAFSGLIPQADGNSRRFNATLNGTSLSVSLGGQYNANGDPVWSPAEYQRWRESIAATLDALPPNAELVLGAVNGEGGAVLVRLGDQEALFEGPLTGGPLARVNNFERLNNRNGSYTLIAKPGSLTDAVPPPTILRVEQNLITDPTPSRVTYRGAGTVAF